MGVVKEQPVPAVQGPMAANRFDQLMVVPLVDQNQVCVIQLAVEIQRIKVVLLAEQSRVGPTKAANRLLTVLLDQVLTTPGPNRLENGDVMPPSEQFGDNAPQKMRVPVVPV